MVPRPISRSTLESIAKAGGILISGKVHSEVEGAFKGLLVIAKNSTFTYKGIKHWPCRSAGLTAIRRYGGVFTSSEHPLGAPVCTPRELAPHSPQPKCHAPRARQPDTSYGNRGSITDYFITSELGISCSLPGVLWRWGQRCQSIAC